MVFSHPLAMSISVSSTWVFKIETAGSSPAAPAAARAAAEEFVQAEHREDVRDVHVREVVLSCDAGVAELVVAPAFLVVGEDLVGLSAFLELDLGLGLVTVGAVGMILHRQPAVGALDLTRPSAVRVTPRIS